MRQITPLEKLTELSPTPEQDEALVKVFEQQVLDSQHPDFAEMTFTDWIVKHVFKASYDDCIMADVPYMCIGIETNGYTHT
jgi:hypothetical protein|tara:strand:+ start:307 stop:549 length:243 start_codon:yes stop_codon:yes gene_type:complete